MQRVMRGSRDRTAKPTESADKNNEPPSFLLQSTMRKAARILRLYTAARKSGAEHERLAESRKNFCKLDHSLLPNV
jgi:hypothetical protein